MVTPLPRRRPWKFAREVITLDHLSHGRVIVGAGLGFPPDADFAVFGDEADERVRGAQLDEALVWRPPCGAAKTSSHRGEHYEADARFLPVPVQRPHPPVWIACSWPKRAGVVRARQWQGIVPISIDGEPLTPSGIAEIVAALGPVPDGFDVVAARAPGYSVADYERAGATWLIESRWPDGDWFAELEAAAERDRSWSRLSSGDERFSASVTSSTSKMTSIRALHGAVGLHEEERRFEVEARRLCTIGESVFVSTSGCLYTSAWMNVARSATLAWAWSSTSSTGPQMAVWQKAGVAMSNTVGLPIVRAWSSETSCSGQAGVRVQMGVTPWPSAAVGVGTAGSFSPGFGYGMVRRIDRLHLHAGPLVGAHRVDARLGEIGDERPVRALEAPRVALHLVRRSDGGALFVGDAERHRARPALGEDAVFRAAPERHAHAGAGRLRAEELEQLRVVALRAGGQQRSGRAGEEQPARDAERGRARRRTYPRRHGRGRRADGERRARRERGDRFAARRACASSWACAPPRTAAVRKGSAGAAPCSSTASPGWRV